MAENVKGRELSTGKKVESIFLKNKHVLKRSTPYIHPYSSLPDHFLAGKNLDANYGEGR